MKVWLGSILANESKKLWLIPICLALFSFYIVLSISPLDFHNIGWLAGGGDPSQHYLGWAFFHQSPWTLPLGSNPGFGLELSSSIVFSDSIPLLAIFFKLFSPWLSMPFQYFGLWLLICYVLQALGAWLLSGLVSKDMAIRLIITSYFLFAPIWLWRFVVTNSLAAHFLLLFSLYLILSKPRKISLWIWCTLLAASAAIHFYLLAMVFVLWVVAILECGNLFENQVLKRNLLTIVVSISLLLLIFWQCGYFAVQGQSAVSGSYGIGHLNLLGLFDSNGWSYVLPNLKETPTSYNSFDRALSYFEGYSYLGLGVIFCLSFAIRSLYREQFPLKKFIGQFPYLFSALCLLTLFAISNNIGIAAWNFKIPLPESILAVASILRASARMFWPAYYVLVFFILLVVIRGYSKRVAIAILAAGLFIQVIDLSAGWLPLRKRLIQSQSSNWNTSLVDPFWSEAAKRYKKVIRIATSNHDHNWETFAYFAARHQMATSSIFLSRIDDQKLDQFNQHLLRQVSLGQYSVDTLYILENNQVISALKNINSSTDLFARIDGFNIIAPGWLSCAECYGVAREKWVSSLVPRYQIGELISISRSGKNIHPFVLLSGWAYPESWGTWSDGRSANLAFTIPQGGPKSLILDVRAFVGPSHPSQIIEIWIDRKLYQIQTLTKDQHNLIEVPINDYHLKQGYITIDFNFLNPARPIDLGPSDDERTLSIALETAIFK